MSIELPDSQRSKLQRLTAGKALANRKRGDQISKIKRLKSLSHAARPSNKEPRATRHGMPAPLDLSKLRCEEDIRKDLAQMLGSQLQSQLIRWGFV